MLWIGLYLEPQRSWANAAAMLITSFRNSEARTDLSFIVSYSGVEDGQPTSIADDCIVVPRRPFGLYPSFNKIRVIELAAELNLTQFLLLDHDIIAGPRVSDLVDNPQPEFGAVENLKVQLTAAFGSRVADFVRKAAGCSIDDLRYFNTGVVSLNERGVQGLADAWAPIALTAISELPNDSSPRPYCNLTMSVAAAQLQLEIVSYPTAFNQRNWGDLPAHPVILHYNNWDATNLIVKADILKSREEFIEFLNSTDNRFWIAYRTLFISAVTDPSYATLADDLFAAIAR